MNGIDNGWMEGFVVQINLFHALRDSFICTSACKHKQGFDFTKANACTRPLHASFVPTRPVRSSPAGPAVRPPEEPRFTVRWRLLVLRLKRCRAAVVYMKVTLRDLSHVLNESSRSGQSASKRSHTNYIENVAHYTKTGCSHRKIQFHKEHLHSVK